MKPKFALAAILSSAAIASSISLGSVSSAQPCSLSSDYVEKQYDSYEEQYEQADWLRSPWVALITLPGIAIAAALSLGERYYKG